MLGRLPKSMLAIFVCMSMERLDKYIRYMPLTILDQLSTGELANVVQGVLQSFRIEIDIKKNGVKMGGHDHICIDTQMFIFDAVVKAIGDDLTGCFANKNGQPLHDREGDVIQADIFDDTISFHVGIIK